MLDGIPVPQKEQVIGFPYVPLLALLHKVENCPGAPTDNLQPDCATRLSSQCLLHRGLFLAAGSYLPLWSSSPTAELPVYCLEVKSNQLIQ